MFLIFKFIDSTIMTTKLDKFLDINLSNNLHFKGKCIDETETQLVIIDIHGDRVEIAKRMVVICREVNA